ncbi:hypothetical protein N7460_003689 [Penicillium canescens]|uniref:Uncharacterized protein n=1 Tax=Penicillium canescens TaxID=5083 RepID=A0AAD6IIA6_PENCN|nr:hypothetical protein N7444_012097 [Penicillium canescens]KAJ6047542.1 hypothetical protein N7460_003689 [Penicillium canescens]
MAIQSRSDTLVADKGLLATVWPLAPLKLITICSSAWTAGILAWAIVLGDGPAVVSIVLVSLASSFHSAASFWQSRVIPRRTPSDAPPSDIVIRTREGAFIVVHSNAEVCGDPILNVSRLWHWNLGSLNITATSRKQSNNYTQVLWEAIYATKEIQWALTGKLVPSTDPWKMWLDEAKANCYNPDWDREGARDMWMRHFLSAPVEGSKERASQAVSKDAVDVSDVSMRQLDMPKKRTTLILELPFQ